MKNKIRIVSDGTNIGTTVYDSQGNPIDGITRISFDLNTRYGATELVKIELEVIASVDIEGEAILKEAIY